MKVKTRKKTRAALGMLILATIVTTTVACGSKGTRPDLEEYSMVATEGTADNSVAPAVKSVEPEWWQNRGPAYQVNEGISSVIYSTDGTKSAFLEPGEIFVTEGSPAYKNTIKVFFKNNADEINSGYIVFDDQTVKSFYTYIGD